MYIFIYVYMYTYKTTLRVIRRLRGWGKGGRGDYYKYYSYSDSQ